MKNKKLAIIISTVAGLTLFVVILEKTGAINLYQKTPTSTPKSSQGPTDQQKQQEFKANSDTKKQVIEDKVPSNTSTSGGGGGTSKSIELTARQEANNTVTIFTKLSGLSEGSCKLTTTNGSKTNTQSTTVIYQPEFSSCAGFTIPIDSLGKGLWILNLAVTSGGSTEKTITFEVK